MSSSSNAFFGFGFLVPHEAYSDVEDTNEWAEKLLDGLGLHYLLCGPEDASLLIWASVADLREFDRKGPGYVQVLIPDAIDGALLMILESLHGALKATEPLGFLMAGVRW